jgi:hypothetical protein
MIGMGTPDAGEPVVAKRVAEQPPISKRRSSSRTSELRRLALILSIGWITKTP